MRIDLRAKFTPRFFHELESVGAVSLRLVSAKFAQSLANSVSAYCFSQTPEREGPRRVFQHFAACEEDDIPPECLVRVFSRSVSDSLNKSVSMNRTNFFRPPLELNDHLLLNFPPGDLGLGAHRDHSKYVNLIVSLTLIGQAEFNLHETPDGAATTTFVCEPGIAVFMRAPGFLHEEVRPYHSVTAIGEERTSLVLKQRRV